MNSLYKFFRAIFFVFLLALFTTQFISAQGVVSRPTKQTPQKITPKVQVSKPDGYINGHGYVDLGLPSGKKWATTNIGADTESDAGSYFAWGEISTKNEYTKDNAKVYPFQSSLGSIIGNPKYDAAKYSWQSSWQLPSKEDFKELYDNSKMQWVKINGKYGRKITGPNGKSIFLPASGWIDGKVSHPLRINQVGCYWTGSEFLDSPEPIALRFGDYIFYCSRIDYDKGAGYFGYTIRPVSL